MKLRTKLVEHCFCFPEEKPRYQGHFLLFLKRLNTRTSSTNSGRQCCVDYLGVFQWMVSIRDRDRSTHNFSGKNKSLS